MALFGCVDRNLLKFLAPEVCKSLFRGSQTAMDFRLVEQAFA